MKNYLLPFCVAALLVSGCGDDKKDDPKPPVVQPTAAAFTLSVNGGPSTALNGGKAVTARFNGAQSQLFLYGVLPDGRTLDIRFQSTATNPATSTTAPLQSMALFMASTNQTQPGSSLSGTATNDTATKRAKGTFSGTFADGTRLSGEFSNVVTE